MQLTTSIHELTNNPAHIINHLQYDAVAIMENDKAMQKSTSTPKKSVKAFVGILKDKTNVRLTIDELNTAIAKSGAKTGRQGL